MTDAELIEAFVGEFTKREALKLFRQFSLPDGVAPGDVVPLLTEPWHEDADKDVDGWATWRPRRVQTPHDALETLYKVVPGPLPPLYERLILTYQWAEVDLGKYRLSSNFPPPLEGLIKVQKADSVMFRALSSHRLVQFGKGPGADYDPVCFDLKKRSADGDCAVIRADHEEILNRERLVVVEVLAGSFRELIRQTLTAAPPN